MTSQNQTQSDSPHERFFAGEQDLPLEHATAGALRVARRHLKEAQERQRKARERLGFDDINGTCEMPGDSSPFLITSGEATTDQAIGNIERELDRRDEPYDA